MTERLNERTPNPTGCVAHSFRGGQEQHVRPWGPDEHGEESAACANAHNVRKTMVVVVNAPHLCKHGLTSRLICCV